MNPGNSKSAKFLTLILILFFACSCNPKRARQSEVDNQDATKGRVIAVIDGDTYDVLVEGNRTLRIRMEGIDAPERGMPYYRVAKNYLSDLCFGKQVNLQITGRDHHNRVLAFAFLDDGTELSHAMLSAGMAWHYLKYNQDQELAALEQEARLNKRGLWADAHPVSPWEIRSLRRKGVSAKDSL